MSETDAEPSLPASEVSPRRKKRRRRSRLGKIRGALQDRASLILTVLVALGVVSSLLAVGTVHVQALLAIAPLVLLAGGFAIWIEDDPKRRFPAPVIILGLLALYSLLQSFALPYSWVKTLSPAAAATWADALRLALLPEPWKTSLSVEPGASRVEALKWLCYASIFAATAKLARDQGGQRGVVILVGSALLGGLLSVLHGLFGIKDWLWLYSPEFARPPWAIAPLLNPNNFAGYLNLALFSGLGLLFVRKPVIPRWVTAFAIVLLAALVILSGSRGAVLALGVGFALSALAFRYQQRRARLHGYRVLPAWIPLLGLGLAAVVLAAIGATDVVWQQLLDETTGKLRILEYSQRIIAEHLWFGTGRGSFGTAFAPYRQILGETIMHYAENFVVQWVVEWGLPVALLALAGLFWTLRPGRHGFGKQAMQTAALSAVAVLLLQNLADLATEITAVALATFAVLGTVHGTSRHDADRRSGDDRTKTPPARALVPTVLAAIATLSGMALVLLVATTGLPDSVAQRRELQESLERVVGKPKGSPAFTVARSKVRTALLRFPGDPYVPLIGALLTRESGESPYVWLNQALRRDPLSARPHYLLAETLASRGAVNQALLELKLAAQLSPAFVSPAASRAAAWTKDLEQLMRAVPDGQNGVKTLNALARANSSDRERRDELLRRSLERAPRDVATNALAAQLLLTALSQGEGSCVGAGKADCETRLRTHAAVVIDNPEDRQAAVHMKARLMAYEQRFDAAEAYLAEQCVLVPEPMACNYLRTSYAAKLKDNHRFADAAMMYTAQACSNSLACAKAFDWLGNLELARGNLNSALSRFERSAEEHPTPQAWLRVAELSAKLGHLSQARAALNTARRLGGGSKVAELEQRLRVLQRERMLETLAQ